MGSLRAAGKRPWRREDARRRGEKLRELDTLLHLRYWGLELSEVLPARIADFKAPASRATGSWNLTLSHDCLEMSK